MVMDFKLTRKLDIDALRALCAIEDCGGVTRAADQLGVSQSAVSHKVRRLETSLDCDLLSRRPNAPLFTEAGRDLLGYAHRILGIHDEALRSLSKTPVQGQISLGMTEDTTCSDLARILGRFARLHPAVSVRTQVRQSLVLQGMLAAGAIDVSIMQVFEHEARPADVILFREGVRWVKSPDLRIVTGAPVPFLSFDENCFYRRWAMDIAQEDGTVLQTVLDCASSAGIVTAVRNGMGVAVLNDRHITADMEIIEDRFPAPPGVVYVARVARNTRNEAIQALISEISDEVGSFTTLSVA
jgi:DNA-binding transcriptional LysR family regulator